MEASSKPCYPSLKPSIQSTTATTGSCRKPCGGALKLGTHVVSEKGMPQKPWSWENTRIPSAVSSDEMFPAHLLADFETAQGAQFRRQLAMRECARRAFHHADNDAALRRSILRRDRPGVSAYSPGSG